MMKAAAPITGGISWPPVEPTDSIAAARYAEKPDFFIAGMVTTPTASTFDTAEAPHRRHCQVREEIRAAGARQHLAENRERDHHQHGDLQDRADHAVHVRSEEHT